MKTLTFPLHGGGCWTATFDGERPVAINDIHVNPRNLAHGLSLVNRFCGATETGYSVAEHSLLLLDWIERMGYHHRSARLACLLHDAPEALGVADSNGALKKQIAQPTRAFEAMLSRSLWQRLVLSRWASLPGWERVWSGLHDYDQQLGNWEAGWFGFAHDQSWFAAQDNLTVWPGFPRCLPAREAERAWLQAWEDCCADY